MTSATDNRTTELLPCPFCGGEAEIVTFDFDIWDKNAPVGVGCSMCSVVLAEYSDYKRFATEAEAIAAWNTRAELGSGTCEDVGHAAVFKCSECGWYSPVFTFGNGMPCYCPNCGRKVVDA